MSSTAPSACPKDVSCVLQRGHEGDCSPRFRLQPHVDFVCTCDEVMCIDCADLEYERWLKATGIRPGMDRNTARLLAGEMPSAEEMEEARRLK